MSNDDTWIEPPVFKQEPPEESLPPLSPPPEPNGGGRRWLLIGLLAGAVILVVCLGAAFVGWRVYTTGGLSFTAGGTETPDAAALTQTALATEVQGALQPTDTPLLAATATASSTSTVTPASPPSETPSGTPTSTPAVPIFTASQAIFCRLGPSSIYQEVRTMNGGDSEPILGKSISPVDGTSIWWQVDVDDRLCFVSSDFGSVEGDVTNVPLIIAPATPTPTPTFTPTPTPTATATATP